MCRQKCLCEWNDLLSTMLTTTHGLQPSTKSSMLKSAEINDFEWPWNTLIKMIHINNPSSGSFLGSCQFYNSVTTEISIRFWLFSQTPCRKRHPTLSGQMCFRKVRRNGKQLADLQLTKQLIKSAGTLPSHPDHHRFRTCLLGPAATHIPHELAC